MSEEWIQIVMHPVLREAFEQWLRERKLHLYSLPTEPDDLPTYGIGILSTADTIDVELRRLLG